jgi:hypothetical protein
VAETAHLTHGPASLADNAGIDVAYSFSLNEDSSRARLIPRLSRSSDGARPGRCFLIAIILSTMPARHHYRYSVAFQILSTITPEFCPRSAGIGVHVALESLSTMAPE